MTIKLQHLLFASLVSLSIVFSNSSSIAFSATNNLTLSASSPEYEGEKNSDNQVEHGVADVHVDSKTADSKTLGVNTENIGDNNTLEGDIGRSDTEKKQEDLVGSEEKEKSTLNKPTSDSEGVVFVDPGEIPILPTSVVPENEKFPKHYPEAEEDDGDIDETSGYLFDYEPVYYDHGDDEIYDPSITEGIWVRLYPDFATDGQRVLVRKDNLKNVNVLLKGYKYDIVPDASNFNGVGKENIYCGCTRIRTMLVTIDVPSEIYYFSVPIDAPSGQYDVFFLPENIDCPRPGIGLEEFEMDKILGKAKLSVTPSYIVSKLEKLDIIGNSEDDNNNPAELNFVFAGHSGQAFDGGSGDARFPVMFSGSFPGGNEHSAHLTNADNTQFLPDLPVFIGRESDMLFSDCDEECGSLPDGLKEICEDECQIRREQARYSGNFGFVFAGTEADTDGPTWLAYPAGLATAALGCYASFELGFPKEGCSESATLGVSVGKAVQGALSGDDDNLGVVEKFSNYDLFDSSWGPMGSLQGPNRLGGPSRGKGKGTIDVYYKNYRVGAPRILQYKVTLKSIKILKSYEEGLCADPNEVFIQARVFLYNGQNEFVSSTRYPRDSSHYILDEGETEDFQGSGLILKSETFNIANAPDSPLIYLEIGVWEDDSENDLIGLYSETLFLTDLLTTPHRNSDELLNDYTSDGHLVRRVIQSRSKIAHGYTGSDNHCYNSSVLPLPHDWNPDATEGEVELDYDIEVTALKYYQHQ